MVYNHWNLNKDGTMRTPSSLFIFAALFSVNLFAVADYDVTIGTGAPACPAEIAGVITADQNCYVPAAAVNAALASGNLEISATGNIYLAEEIGWSANKLTLTATNGDVLVEMSPTGGFSAKADISGSGAIAINGLDYTVITALGAEGSRTGTDLQGILGALSGNYVLGADIDAASTSSWNTGSGFEPLGDNTGTFFTGKFHGLGHTIDHLYINVTSRSAALFDPKWGTLQSVGLTNVDITSSGDIAGALVGWGENATIINSFSTGSVKGNIYPGGLIGGMCPGYVSMSYSNADVEGSEGGGLFGAFGCSTTFSDSFATGSVNGYRVAGVTSYIDDASVVNRVYSTGAVTGTSLSGLIALGNSATVNNSFWDTETSGLSTSTFGTGKTTAEMKTLSTFTDAGWNITGADGAYPTLTGRKDTVWEMVPAHTPAKTVPSLMLLLL